MDLERRVEFALAVARLGFFAAALLSGCVSRASRDADKTPVASAPIPRTTATTLAVEPVAAAACAFSGDSSRRSDCRVRTTAVVDLDHDTRNDCVGWTRCGPNEPTPSDGGILYPRDVVAVALARGKFLTLYSNRDVSEAEQFEALSVVRVGSEQRLLLRVEGYGTGNVQNWNLLNIEGDRVQTFREPSLAAAVASLLGPGERLGKSLGLGVEVHDGELEVARLVYRNGDPNCCPSGGVIRVRLAVSARGLVVGRAWRETDPEAP